MSISVLNKVVQSNVVTIVVKPKEKRPPVSPPAISNVVVKFLKDGKEVNEVYEGDVVTCKVIVEFEKEPPADVDVTLNIKVMAPAVSTEPIDTKTFTFSTRKRVETYSFNFVAIKPPSFPGVDIFLDVTVEACIGEECVGYHTTSPELFIRKKTAYASLTVSGPSEVSVGDVFNVGVSIAPIEVIEKILFVEIEYSSNVIEFDRIVEGYTISESRPGYVKIEGIEGITVEKFLTAVFKAVSEGVATVNVTAKVRYVWGEEREHKDSISIAVRGRPVVKPEIANVFLELVNGVINYDAEHKIFFVTPGVKKVRISIELVSEAPETVSYSGKVTVDGMTKPIVISVPKGSKIGSVETEIYVYEVGKTYTMTVVVEDIVESYSIHVTQAAPPTPVPTVPRIELPTWAWLAIAGLGAAAIGAVVYYHVKGFTEMK